jgi:hypothetical protein
MKKLPTAEEVRHNILERMKTSPWKDEPYQKPHPKFPMMSRKPTWFDWFEYYYDKTLRHLDEIGYYARLIAILLTPIAILVVWVAHCTGHLP